MRGFLISLAAIVAIVVAIYFLTKKEEPIITNFEQCAKVKPVMETYPRHCRAPNGQVFTEESFAIPYQE